MYKCKRCTNGSASVNQADPGTLYNHMFFWCQQITSTVPIFRVTSTCFEILQSAPEGDVFQFLTRLGVFINVNSWYVLCDRKWLLIIFRVIRYSRSHPVPCTPFAQPHSQLFILLTLRGIAFHKVRCQNGIKMACHFLKDIRCI